MREELGLQITKSDIKFWKICKSIQAKEFRAICIYTWNGDLSQLNYEKEEIDLIQWFRMVDVYKLTVVNKSAVWSIAGYEEELFEQNNFSH